MRVALMHEHSWPRVHRGGERYLHDLAWFLGRSSAWEPLIVTGRDHPRIDTVEDTPVHRTWGLPPRLVERVRHRLPPPARRIVEAASSRSGARALRGVRPELVHAMSPAAALAAHRSDAPYVFTTLGAPTADTARRKPADWEPLERAADGAAAVTAVGTRAAEGFAEALGRDVHALHPGLRLASFPPNLTARTGPPRILFASTVTPRFKGFPAVLVAFAEVAARHPDAILDVLGPGDVPSHLEAAPPAVRRVRGRIRHRVPSTAEMPEAYAAGSVTVLASRGEAFGLVLAESLACGTPIVASDEGGPAEILADGEGRVGYAARPHDPDAIAAALLAAIALASAPATPGACREHAARWDWDGAVGPRHLELYDGLV